jgi:multidrug efflux pump
MMLVTGMTVGTLFTLFVVPVFYSLIVVQHQQDQGGAMLEGVESEKLTLAGAEA